jgi:DNA-binding beta-propeller fold protein YncE
VTRTLFLLRALAPALLAAAGAAPAFAAGARSFKSGPIQITADGAFVWVVNPDHDSVSRLATATDAVTEFPLPSSGSPPQHHAPWGVSVSEDGSEVWVACHDSDRVYVLRGSDGGVLARIDLPWGSGPYGVALSRDQGTALVTLLRGSRVAVLDRASRQVTALLDTFRSPLGIAWMEDGVSAWITHRHVLDRLPRVSRIDVSSRGQSDLRAVRPGQSSPLWKRIEASTRTPEPNPRSASASGHSAAIPEPLRKTPRMMWQ